MQIFSGGLRLTSKWVLILQKPWDVKHSLVSYIYISLGALRLKEQPAHDFKIILYNPPFLLDFVQICRLSFCKLKSCRHSLFFRLYGTNWMNRCSYFNLQEAPFSSVTFRTPKGILLITDSTISENKREKKLKNKKGKIEETVLTNEKRLTIQGET